MEKSIKQVISRITKLDVDDIRDESSLVSDLGMYSLDVVEAIIEIEEKNNIVIEFDEAEKIVTVLNLIELVKLKKNE